MPTEEHHMRAEAEGAEEACQDAALLEDPGGDRGGLWEKYLHHDEADDEDAGEYEEGDDAAVAPLCEHEYPYAMCRHDQNIPHK